jgi:hypothetical protein
VFMRSLMRLLILPEPTGAITANKAFCKSIYIVFSKITFKVMFSDSQKLQINAS